MTQQAVKGWLNTKKITARQAADRRWLINGLSLVVFLTERAAKADERNPLTPDVHLTAGGAVASALHATEVFARTKDERLTRAAVLRKAGEACEDHAEELERAGSFELADRFAAQAADYFREARGLETRAGVRPEDYPLSPSWAHLPRRRIIERNREYLNAQAIQAARVEEAAYALPVGQRAVTVGDVAEDQPAHLGDLSPGDLTRAQGPRFRTRGI